MAVAGGSTVSQYIRNTNAAVIEFYMRIGFKTEHVVSLGKCLEPDI